MLSVGVAVRLNKLPEEVRSAPWEDVLLVAAYCQLEAEDFEKRKPPPAAPLPHAPARAGTRVERFSVKYVAKKKE